MNRIKFPFLSSEIYDVVESMLHGGYSSSNSMYSNLNGGFFLNDDDEDDEDLVSLGWFSDMNALYPSRSEKKFPFLKKFKIQNDLEIFKILEKLCNFWKELF